MDFYYQQLFIILKVILFLFNNIFRQMKMMVKRKIQKVNPKSKLTSESSKSVKLKCTTVNFAACICLEWRRTNWRKLYQSIANSVLTCNVISGTRRIKNLPIVLNVCRGRKLQKRSVKRARYVRVRITILLVIMSQMIREILKSYIKRYRCTFPVSSSFTNQI